MANMQWRTGELKADKIVGLRGIDEARNGRRRRFQQRVFQFHERRSAAGGRAVWLVSSGLARWAPASPLPLPSLITVTQDGKRTNSHKLAERTRSC